MATTTATGQAGEHVSVGRRADGRLTLGARLALVVICVAVFLSALDQYVVVTLLDPSRSGLVSDLGVSLNQLDKAAWVVNGYILGYIVAMPLMGRISDVYGRRRVFALCLVLFALGSLLTALAPALGSQLAPDYTTLGGAILTPLYDATQAILGLLSRIGVDTSLPALDVLTGARFIQAIGGGALVPIAIAVVSDLFGMTRRGLALGIVGAIAEAGGVLGPFWGAWVNAQWGWQWIFYLNLPIAALLFVAGLLTLPRLDTVRSRIDVLGATLLGAALVCLSLGFGVQGQLTLSPASAPVAIKPPFLIAAAVLLLLFVVRELMSRAPAVDVRQFGNRAFASAGALSFLTGAPLVVAIVLIPTFISYMQPSSGDLGGALVLLRMTVFIPVGALAGGWLATRIGCPFAATLGTLLTATGLFLMSLWPPNVGDAQITLATTLAGLGFGLVIAPTSTSALNAAGSGRQGMAASVVTVLRMAGMLLGLSWAFLFAVARFTALVAAAQTISAAALQQILHEVFSQIFLLAAITALLGAIPALLLWRRARDKTVAQPEQSYASYVAPLA